MYPTSFYTTVASEVHRSMMSLETIYEDEPIPHISSLFDLPIMRLVCGEDDREILDANNFPYRMICRLVITAKNGKKYYGTGFFISPKCVITSGHCVHLHTDWAKSVMVIPGANGKNDDHPFGFAVSEDFRSIEGWTKNKNQDFDYGAVILPDTTLFEKVQSFFPISIIDTDEVLFNAGYPAEIGKDKEQWGSSGRIKKLTSHRIFYEIDTEKGNSGSPLFIRNQDKLFVVGVHSFGACPNFCVRVNENVLETWNSWSQL